MKKVFLVTVTLSVLLTLLNGCSFIKTPKIDGNSPEAGQTTPAVSNVTEVTDTTSLETPSTETTDITGPVAIETDQYDYSSDYIDVSIELPRLKGLSDTAVQDSINAIFSNIMTEAKDGVESAEQESKQIAEDSGSVNPYMIYISFSVPYNNNGMVSILVSDYRYNGGAHGGDMWSDYNIDLRTGSVLKLDDLMEKDSGYREMINSTIRAEIDKRAAADELYENAPFEDVGEDPAFYLTSDAVVFYFQQYEYFPYAAGIQEFPIKYADLTGKLLQDYASLTITPVVLDNTTDNTLSIGDIGQVLLQGNPTTGYSWQYTISDTSVIDISSDKYQTDAPEGIVGAGGTYLFEFRALKQGTATITFKYYREWLGETDTAPEDTVEYTVTVK